MTEYLDKALKLYTAEQILLFEVFEEITWLFRSDSGKPYYVWPVRHLELEDPFLTLNYLGIGIGWEWRLHAGKQLIKGTEELGILAAMKGLKRFQKEYPDYYQLAYKENPDPILPIP